VEGDFARSGFSDALVILGAAGIVIPAFARFRISPIIGFILIGMLVGPAGLGRLTGGMPWLHYVTLGGQGGGGRPDMAQGGGPDGSKANEALDAVRHALEKVAA
jgi:hypothetical protein